MGEKTGILWTDHTFNPWIGCTKVSPGCTNCYAERENNFHKWTKGWGPGTERKRTSKKNWLNPIEWTRKAVKDGVLRRIFCASLADVFDPEVTGMYRLDLWRIIDTCLRINTSNSGCEWLLLTKRPEYINEFLPYAWLIDPPPWLRIGVTAENQEMADKRIPKLFNQWIGKTFVSIEPMLGPVSLQVPQSLILGQTDPWIKKIDWVICGGESGTNARPMHPDWVRSLRDQCQAAGVPFFFKQWGEWAQIQQFDYDHQVNQLDGHTMVARVGKKAAGRLLDGREWNEFPEVE